MSDRIRPQSIGNPVEMSAGDISNTLTATYYSAVVDY